MTQGSEVRFRVEILGLMIEVLHDSRNLMYLGHHGVPVVQCHKFRA